MMWHEAIEEEKEAMRKIEKNMTFSTDIHYPDGTSMVIGNCSKCRMWPCGCEEKMK